MSDSVHGGGVSTSVHAGIPHPLPLGAETPPGADTPPGSRPPRADTPMCDSVHRGGVSLSACWDTTLLGADNPRNRHPPGADIPPGSRHPPEQTSPSGADTPTPSPEQTAPPRIDTPQEQTSPRHRACWEIWSMRGRYASYWNGSLLCKCFAQGRVPGAPLDSPMVCNSYHVDCNSSRIKYYIVL